MMCECDGCRRCQPYPKWYRTRPCTGMVRKVDRDYFPNAKPCCHMCRQLAEGGGAPPAPGEPPPDVPMPQLMPPPDVPMTTSLSSASAAPNAKAQMETLMARMEALIDATTSLNSAVVALTARVSRIERALTNADSEWR